MESRERILTAFNHQEPDRIPVDLSGHRSSGISAIAYAQLRDHLHLPPKPVRIYDMVQQLAIVDEDILDRFDVDTVELGRAYLLNDHEWKEWALPDGTPCLIPNYVNVEERRGDWYLLSEEKQELGIQKKGWLFFEQTFYPLQDRDFEKEDFSDLEDMLELIIWSGVPSPGSHFLLDEDGLFELREGAMRLRASTGRAIIGLFGGSFFETAQELLGMERYLVSLKVLPNAVQRLNEKLLEIYIRDLEKWLGAVGPYIDIVCFGDDLGSQSGPLISPRMYCTLIKPFHSQLWKRAKELTDIKVMLHCCGGIRELLPDLIDAGLDAINPVQFTAKGMDIQELKDEFGHKVVLWGAGCDTQNILPSGSSEEIKDNVRQQTNILSPGGGFVFQPVHNILPNVPPQNIVAMFDALKHR
jgi:uroporphyrinogen decarboxylase